MDKERIKLQGFQKWAKWSDQDVAEEIFLSYKSIQLFRKSLLNLKQENIVKLNELYKERGYEY